MFQIDVDVAAKVISALLFVIKLQDLSHRIVLRGFIFMAQYKLKSLVIAQMAQKAKLYNALSR